MNVLWPIIVIIAGAFGVWFVRYLNAPRPFEIALIVVVALLLVFWLLGSAGMWIDLDPVVDVD